jgi:hypothetical protein
MLKKIHSVFAYLKGFLPFVKKSEKKVKLIDPLCWPGAGFPVHGTSQQSGVGL